MVKKVKMSFHTFQSINVTILSIAPSAAGPPYERHSMGHIFEDGQTETLHIYRQKIS